MTAWIGTGANKRHEFLSGTSTAIAIDPTTGDPWGANETRLASKRGYGAVPDGWWVPLWPPWSADDGKEAQFEVRAFTQRGVEDPVTGSLNAGLAQWLIGAGLAPERYIASQGTVLGRAGRVHVDKVGEDIWIGCSTVTCIEGKLTL